ncbi:MAG: hypothetical protein JNK05_40535 [Myxococcales bacterium]|nr:hypothetical protein [Myxococcales bacterium]
MSGATGHRRYETVEYNNKRYTVPVFDRDEGCVTIVPREGITVEHGPDDVLVNDLNVPFSMDRYKVPRRPLNCGVLDPWERSAFVAPSDARNVLDMPIKFPGSDFRLPMEYAQWASVVQRVADAEWALNKRCYDEYYCYMTLRRERVPKGGQGHYAPCHVDGFQGARWTPKVRTNHTYTITNALPTTYFVQPFDLSALDVAKHDVFWEMNRQVALTNSAHAWSDYPDFSLMLMDAYCVHIAMDAPEERDRVWLRFSFEVRQFDRLGNGHNPFFAYDWPMVPRDIEQLGLVPFDPTCDWTLRVFPYQREDGSRHPKGVYTVPNLRPRG